MELQQGSRLTVDCERPIFAAMARCERPLFPKAWIRHLSHRVRWPRLNFGVHNPALAGVFLS